MIFDETESKSATKIENILQKLETKGDKRKGKMQNQPSTQHWYEIEFPSSKNGSFGPSTSTAPSISSGTSYESPSNISASDIDSPPPESSIDKRTFVYINPIYNDGDYLDPQTSEHQLLKQVIQLSKDVKSDEQNKTGTWRSHKNEENFSLITNDFTEPSIYKEAVKHK